MRAAASGRVHRNLATVGAASVLAAFCVTASADVSVPETAATRVNKAPEVDGEVLADPVWAAVAPVTAFWQTTPDEGRPATEKTEVRIAYTAEALYFGIVCFDRRPDGIVSSASQRDSPLDATDSVLIALDTFLDGQNGFVFGTNPAGIQYDGLISNEGAGADNSPTTQQRGTLWGFNINWDGSWDVRARVTDVGWSAEFAIPFRTLRYKDSAQVWGLNLQRNIRRRSETAYWAPLPRQFNLHHVSMAGRLQGIHVASHHNLKVAPYVMGRGLSGPHAAASDPWTGDFGADVKYSVTPSLTLDATLNTDFAQVEVDEQQINLDRFDVFFPEKRPFFLENAGHFAVGNPGETELFFSRRIGVSATGEIVPIVGGARLSGRAFGANLGLVNMQTRALPGEAPANNFSVARLARELPNRSSVGIIFVGREATTDTSEDADYNRTIGLDGRWGLGRYGELSGFVARSFSPGVDHDNHAFQVSARHDSPEWELNARYLEVGEAFNPQVGFVRRRGFRKPLLFAQRRYRPRRFLGLQEIRPHVLWRAYFKPDGFYETGFLHLDVHWQWKNDSELQTALNVTREGLRGPFEIFPGVVVPVGGYDHKEAQIIALSSRQAPVRAVLRLTAGGFFGGRRVAFSPSFRWRLGDALNAEVVWDRNEVVLPGGTFVTNLARVRASYGFSARLFAEALLQYNDRIDVWSVNARVGWLQTANVGFFVVYDQTGGERDRRSLTFKFSRLFDVLH